MGKRRDEPDEPTLELPSFFRRRKRRADDAEHTESGEQTAPAPVAENEPLETPPATEPAEAEPTPATGPPREEPVATAVEPEPEHSPETDRPAPGPENTSVLEPAPADTAAAAEPAGEPAGESEPAPGGRRAARAARKPRALPTLSPGAASLVAGAVVGLVGTGLTWAALQGCEALRGTDSCGGPGLLVLVAILALMVIAGALLLKALRVTEANATSFLGVGLMTVIVLVTLMESLFSAWMFLAVPVLTALSYLAAQWVSTRFVDTEERSPGVDVR